MISTALAISRESGSRPALVKGSSLSPRYPLRDGLRGARDVRHLGAGAVPGVRVGRQALVDASAEQVVGRAAQRLADDVPERLLDRADGAVQVGAATRELVAEHLLPDLLDLEGRLPDDDAMRQHLDARRHHLRLELAGPLADARDPVVGVDMREDEVAPACVDDMHVDALDAAILATAAGGDLPTRLRHAEPLPSSTLPGQD